MENMRTQMARLVHETKDLLFENATYELREDPDFRNALSNLIESVKLLDSNFFDRELPAFQHAALVEDAKSVAHQIRWKYDGSSYHDLCNASESLYSMSYTGDLSSYCTFYEKEALLRSEEEEGLLYDHEEAVAKIEKVVDLLNERRQGKHIRRFRESMEDSLEKLRKWSKGEGGEE